MGRKLNTILATAVFAGAVSFTNPKQITTSSSLEEKTQALSDSAKEKKEIKIGDTFKEHFPFMYGAGLYDKGSILSFRIINTSDGGYDLIFFQDREKEGMEYEMLRFVCKGLKTDLFYVRNRDGKVYFSKKKNGIIDDIIDVKREDIVLPETEPCYGVLHKAPSFTIS